MPTVSVIMPAYNAQRTVGEAIESVLRQTFGDFELIVIDDGSTDGTADVIEGYAADPRIRFLKNPRNSGVSATRNYGIREAVGEWIAFLDSDDLWREDKLELQLGLLEKYPDAALTYTASSFISSEGEPFGYIMEAEEKIDRRTLLKKNLISCSSAMIRADVMKGIQMPGDRMHEDYYVWLTVLERYDFAYGINLPLLIYRLSAGSKSSGRLRSARMLFNSYRATGYGRLRSFLYMLRYTAHSVTKRHRIKTK